MYKQFHLSIPRRNLARHPGVSVALALFLMAPSSAFADDIILDHFTHSITKVYVSSEECADTLVPGPAQYMKLITDYLNVFYPGGVAYWILPPTDQRIKDRTTCIISIQEKLMDYQAARRDYKNNYPDEPNPPVLLAYNWENGASRPSSSLPQSPPGDQQPSAAAPKASPWQ